MSRVTLTLRSLVGVAAVAAFLFGVAGRADLPAYLGIFLALGLSAVLTLDLDLIRERMRPGPGGRDNLTLLRLGMLVVFAGHWLIAGLDVGRYHWSDDVPPWLQFLGLAGVAAGCAVWIWAMRVNRFFSSAVRIQTERGHHVITGGPYRFVRHPGYAAFVGVALFSGLALGSYLSLLPSLLWAAAFFRRAALEDGMLREELTGYADYAGRVRYRLMPGVW